MECLRFQQLINKFIFDKIEYSDDLKDFIDHARTCKSCYEDLQLYYTIHRGLGDALSPEGKIESTDCDKELADILDFYDECFYKERFMRKAGKISIVIFAIMVICTILYIFARVSGYL